MLAKNIGKPFRVLLDIGVTVPDWFKENVADYKQKTVNLKNISQIKGDWMREFLKVKYNELK